MKRFYFDLVGHDSIALDDEGMELPSIEAAQLEAAQSLAEFVRDTLRDNLSSRSGHRLAIEVRDEQGPVMQVRFTFEVQPLRP